MTSSLHAAFLKTAFDLHPYDATQMAGLGGLAGGVAGGGIGALTGLIGTKSGTPARRKAMLLRSIIGALGGAGIGAAGAHMASHSATDALMDDSEPQVRESVMPARLLAMGQLAQQEASPKSVENFRRLASDPTLMDKTILNGLFNTQKELFPQIKMSPSSTLRILLGKQPLRNSSGMRDEFLRNSEAAMPDPSSKIMNIVWDAIKQHGLAP